MAKTSPEKLAQALRANLKRRKDTPAAKPPPKPAQTDPKPGKKPGFP